MPTRFPAIARLPRNLVGWDFIVGDIHGCYDELMNGLAKACFDPICDRVIAVGDLINHGPDTVKALQLLNAPWFYTVRGNHEQGFIDVVLGKDTGEISVRFNERPWFMQMPAAEREVWAHRMVALPFAMIVGSGKHRFNVVHAEFMGTDSEFDRATIYGLSAAQATSVLFGRSMRGNLIPDAQPGLSTTYCGHYPVPSPERRGSHVLLDTGAGLINLLLQTPDGLQSCESRLTIIKHDIRGPLSVPISEIASCQM